MTVDRTPIGHRRWASAHFLNTAGECRRIGNKKLARVMLRYAAFCRDDPHPCIVPTAFVRAHRRAIITPYGKV